MVRVPRPDLTDDNLYPQVQRTGDGYIGLLDKFEFKVIDHAYLVGDSISFVMMLENDTLSDCTLHLGPPVWVGNSENFLNRWQKEGASRPFIKDGRWVVMAEREHPYAADLLRERYSDAALGSAFRKMMTIEEFDHSATLV